MDKSNKNTDQKDYVNGHIANKCITRNSLKTTDDTEYRNGGSMEFYLENSIIEIENNEGVTFGHKTGQHVILKSPVIQTDSNGYVPMKTDPLKYWDTKLLFDILVIEPYFCEPVYHLAHFQR